MILRSQSHGHREPPQIIAERDAARAELEAAIVANAGLAESLKQECAEHNATKGAMEGWKKMSDAARAGLAEAVGVLRDAQRWASVNGPFDADDEAMWLRIDAILAKHPEAGAVEGKK